MREPDLPGAPISATASLAACLAAILELPLEDVPQPPAGEHATGWRMVRWLGGLGLGLVPVADAGSFAWAGPWIGWVRPSGGGERRAVVMYVEAIFIAPQAGAPLRAVQGARAVARRGLHGDRHLPDYVQSFWSPAQGLRNNRLPGRRLARWCLAQGGVHRGPGAGRSMLTR